MTDLYSNTSGAKTNDIIQELINNAQYKPPNNNNNIINIKNILDNENNNKCNLYKFTIWQLLLPSSNIYNTLCISYDKTYLFIVSFIRICILLIISKYYYNYFNLNNNNWNKDILFIFISFYTLINIILLFIIMLKTQKYPKENIKTNNISNDMSNEITNGINIE